MQVAATIRRNYFGAAAMKWSRMLLFCLLCCAALASSGGSHGRALPGLRMLDHTQAILEATDCSHFSDRAVFNATVDDEERPQPVHLKISHSTQTQQLQHRHGSLDWILESLARDVSRQQVHQHRAAVQNTNISSVSVLPDPRNASAELRDPQKTTAKAVPVTGMVESGVSQGSGEYFMDVYVGTPPRHFWVIVDTGSDLNWLQCEPCQDCYSQAGPRYDPAASSSYTPLPCTAPECAEVADTSAGSCNNSSSTTTTNNNNCRYFYWYGDRSNTTGDLARELFTLNTTANASAPPLQVPMIFGCGHANRGLFRGAAGLLGLGRGALSFSSQLRSRHGRSFSYCLVPRDSNMSVASSLVLGHDARVPPSRHRFTALVPGAVNTFYYVRPVSVTVGSHTINVTSLSSSSDSTIVDTGTTLTYLPEPVYVAVKAAFEAQVAYPLVQVPPLAPCFNVSDAGGDDVRLPELRVTFADGAVWEFPAENYFIQLEPRPGQAVICVAIQGSQPGALSILGNYLQQNFHVLYDVDNERIGFAPADCAALI